MNGRVAEGAMRAMREDKNEQPPGRGDDGLGWYTCCGGAESTLTSTIHASQQFPITAAWVRRAEPFLSIRLPGLGPRPMAPRMLPGWLSRAPRGISRSSSCYLPGRHAGAHLASHPCVCK